MALDTKVVFVLAIISVCTFEPIRILCSEPLSQNLNNLTTMYPFRIHPFASLTCLLLSSLLLNSCEIIRPMLQPLPSDDQHEQASGDHSISPETDYRPNPARSNPPRALPQRHRPGYTRQEEETVTTNREEAETPYEGPRPRTRGGLFVPPRRRTDPGGLPGRDMSVNVMSPEYQQRSQVIDYAYRLEGIPFYNAGDTPDEGFDCSGFTCYVYKQANVQLPRVSAMQAGQGVRKELWEVEPGDLVFFRKPDTNRVFHVAVVVANELDGIKVIHSTTSKGVQVDNISTSSYWKQFPMEARDVLGQGR